MMNVALGGMAAATIPPQSAASRGLPSNPAQGLRRMPPPPVSSMPPPPPIPDKYNPSMSSSGSGSVPLSAAQVIALARDAMNTALQDNESQAAEASGVSTELKPGVTIDLSRRNIEELPDEVVDIIKNELERLALSHNRLSTFPSRFSECTSLRYLNVRNNYIKEFPLALCDLKSLEILDLGRNKIRILPPEIAKLASLKVLAVQKNRIEELPLCLADMVSLQVLKLDGNKITFPPREVLQVQASSPPNEGQLKESEVTEVTVTAHIKKYLKQRALSLNERPIEPDNGGDESSEGVETPRMPMKRVMSGRFPIKVNGNEVSDMRSPALPRVPPIPSRSHARGLSQQNTAIRRPGVMPLTIGNPNERLRSNSETTVQAAKADRPMETRKRIALMSKRANELGTLDETQANNRFSHYRGLSHGSSMTGHLNPNIGSVMSPSSPAEPLLQRPNYVRRLSVLPEQRRESKVLDPIIESAKGILYSIFQIHPMIQLLTRLTSDDTAKRSSLEIVFYNTNVHVEELEQEIQKHEFGVENNSLMPRENENVQRAVLTLISAYSHVCSLLIHNMDVIINNGDPRYLRTMMMLLYNSIMELRVTANEAMLGPPAPRPSEYPRQLEFGDTLKPRSRENSITPTVERSGAGFKMRNGSLSHNPGNLRVATDVPIPFINGVGRTAQVTSATPRSGESFASTSTDGRYAVDSAEERAFEKIYLSLSKSSDLVIRTLPNFRMQFSAGLRNAMGQRAPDHILQCWKSLIAKCTTAIEQTELLKARLSSIKLKEPGVRTDPAFWSLCKGFIVSWAEFGDRLRDSIELIHLPMDFKTRLRPVHPSMKDTTTQIMTSPWGNLFRHVGNMSDSSNQYPMHHGYSSSTSSTQIPLPMTPQSAALGPAVQATVPSTPQSAAFQNAFSGNVFERADALLASGGLHSLSRTNTLASSSTTSLNSIASMTSASDDRYGPSSVTSPNGSLGPMPFRLNGGPKPSF